ncbi:uncharacterized protein LOC134710525 [Mytilus trossulus]|uniref:uncharacterized protein LOC134710525 n=1 Tax=Mytilus trossulus TaxID=6551 RepID=UPI003004D513
MLFQMSEPDLYDFMRSRNIKDDIIRTLIEEKIDSQTIIHMSEEELTKFVPLYGDRKAIIAFSRDRKDTSCEKKKKTKTSLMKKLRAKVNAIKGGASYSSGDEDEDEKEVRSSLSKKLKGNKNAEKKKRLVDLSCFHNDGDAYHQIRGNKGGGPKSFDMEKFDTMGQVLDLAKQLYFPNGHNAVRGKITEYEIKLTDTYFQNIDLQSTVESCYNRLKMRQLRFNFCTEGTTSTIESDELPPLSIPKNRNATAQSGVIEVMEIIDLPPTCLSKPEKSNDIFVTNDFYNAELPDIQTNFDIADFSFDGDIAFGPNVRASNVSLDSTLPLESGSGDTLDRPLEFGNAGTVERKIIRIHRASALMDMIIHFEDPNIMTVDIDAIMVLDNGKEEAGEGDGVFRDCITQFWDEFYEQCTEGRIFKVPVLRHDFQKEEWKAVSRIIRKGFEVSGYWPISIMPAIFEECIHGSIESSLIELFSDYLPEMESQIVKKAISNFNDVDQDDFLEFLDSHSCRKLVNSENVLPIIGELAHKELIQQPRYVIECFRSELRQLQVTPGKLQQIYQEMKPTSKEILKSLSVPENMKEAERLCAGFLKRYIKDLDGEKQKAFLRFCTCSDVLLGMKITIEFFESKGFTRSPIAHTCGRVLQIPSTYDTYPSFRSEFNYLLNSKVWVMDIV